MNKKKEKEILALIKKEKDLAEKAKEEYSHFGIEVSEYERLKNSGSLNLVVSDGVYEFTVSVREFEEFSVLREEKIADPKEGEKDTKQVRILEIKHWKVAPIRIRGVLDSKEVGIA